MTEPLSYETIDASLLEGNSVLRLVLDRPRGNVLTLAMVRELDTALAAHRDQPDLRLVVLRGAGGNFSYGASVEEHRKEQAPELLKGFHQLVRSVAGYPVPVAALVEGACLGGGFEVVLCCHFVFATAGARFGCPEIQLGVFPPVLAALGSQRLGSALAERLLLTGATLDAAAAERLGLVTLLDGEGDPEDALLAWYRETLQPLSAFALRQGIRASRVSTGWLAAFERSLAAGERQYLDEVLPSHDGNEGVEAFPAKRTPAWRNA